MEKTGHRRKLLVQVTLIIVPVFLLVICAVAQTIYISSVNSFLKAQERQIKDIMNDAQFHFPLKTNILFKDDATRKLLFDLLSTHTLYDDYELTDEELDVTNRYIDEPDSLEFSWYERIPEPVTVAVIKDLLSGASDHFNKVTMSSSYESFVLVNASDMEQMRVLIDFDFKNSESDTGKYYNIDISRHPALRELFESKTGEMVFEKTNRFPIEGNYYIGYYPVMIDGSVYSVVGLVYNWDSLHRSVSDTVISAVLIIITGMILVLALLMLFLYLKTIKPMERIQKALLEYAADNNTSVIVKKMYNIKADNEIGYLADTISDLALEVELYTRENIRIAVERERAEKELYEAKVSVMVSQIQPHFMYNALTSIAMMCTIDPETAQEATVTFAKYLRENMDSLKETRPVPFERELEHLKKYLYIEKLRFGKKLNIEYDIQTTDFVIPLLSVQPLVENAVKHGVGMKKKGGTVKISACDTGDAYEVTISDDGVGFDTSAPRADDGRSHVGMDNTRIRLKEMCRGEVMIESTAGVGTAARIILPKEGQNREDTMS